ncbi:hypothetical protein SIL18_19585, partial [Clostridioides difficile]|nr:hypothetical protein [Clostridioides difficile]
TYIPIGKKFLYMNVAKDLFNGEIVAYEISTKMDTKLVNNTVKYSLQGTTQGNGLTGGVPPVRFSM